MDAEEFDEQQSAQVPGTGAERTGVPSVDRVLAEIVQVSELSVQERVAVFERVHEELRRSLDSNPASDIAGA